ncbi:CynX/NimT family MFS transporter [Nonomuraea jiangxiensis]|uniref:Predicted arabinose efflux permease, MFS family n=1 Tax=Nonomuraea jiangxiensis TaxID=633440 RepID=A0A1G8ELI9_9ACTN|nr:MFS transporter [Nonomuraea jiangxiensis]SDH70731.1 Predicted arabinose efflux permease, MFS family [Nonomuraea jiangxiensis]
MDQQPFPPGRPETGGSDWPRIFVVYVAGVVAALGLGKISAVGAQVSDALGLTLSQLGWLISVITAVCAAVGLAGGVLNRRYGTGRMLVAGLAVVTAASALSVAATGFGTLLAVRLVEGLGYLLVTVACPVLIARLAGDRDRAMALSIWGTFVPVGLGLSTLLGGLVGTAAGWRVWLGVVAAVTLACTLVTWRRLPPGRVAEHVGVPVRAGALVRPALLALSFCLIVMATLSVVVLLPAFLVERHGQAAAAAGALTSVISLISVAGGIVAAGLLRTVAPGVLALSGISIVPAAWLAFHEEASVTATAVGTGVISFANGILAAIVFAALPYVLVSLAHMDLATGIVAQFGSLGSMLGPPLFGLLAERGGWHTLVPVTSGAVVGGVTLLVLTLWWRRPSVA